MLRILLLLVLVATPFAAGRAQGSDPVRVVDAAFEAGTVVAGETARLELSLDIAAPWHVYSTEPHPDYAASTIAVTTPGVALAGPIDEPEPRSSVLGGLALRYHEGRFKLVAPLRFDPDLRGDLTVEGTFGFVACDPSRCLPPDEIPFRAAITVSPDAAADEAEGARDEPVTFRGKEGYLTGAATLEPARVRAGERAELRFRFEVVEGRWGYSAVNAGVYALTTAIAIAEGEPFALVGAPRETEPELKKAVEEWDEDSWIHHGAFEVVWTVAVAADAPSGPGTLALTLTYQTCDKDSCLPEDLPLEIPYVVVGEGAGAASTGGANDALGKAVLAALERLGGRISGLEKDVATLLPKPAPVPTPPPAWTPSAAELRAVPERLRGGDHGDVTLRFTTPEPVRLGALDDVFVDATTAEGKPSGRIADVRAVAAETSADGLTHDLTLRIFGKDVARRGDETVVLDVSLPLIAEGRAFDADLEPVTVATVWGLPDLWDWVLRCALAALLALLTPCVFPMIPVTVSFFTKQAGAGRNPFVLPALYVGGIIVSFVAIGTLFTLFFETTGAQVLATNPYVQALFGILFIVFALSLFGVFTLRPPAFLMAKAGAVQGKGGVVGVLGMGLLFSLTSFTCTAPLVGLILVAAAESGEWLMPVIGMTAFSTVLAAPFFFLALFPKLLSGLPRSGGWMNEVKVTLGFLELAFALKFLGVMDASFGWGLLTREAILWIWAVLFVLNGLYVLGLVRFEADAEHRRTGPIAGFVAVLLILFGLHLTTGARGAPMPAIVESLMPPAIGGEENATASAARSAPETAAASPRASNLLGWANHQRFRDDPEGAYAAARDLRVPVFIDFTGVT